jgi:hypothetical protein
MSVGAFVILVSTVINLYKGVSLEYDPLNVYFWFIAGLALSLPHLKVSNPAANSDRSSMQDSSGH